MLPAEVAAAPAAHNSRAADQPPVDAAAPGDAADRADQVARMDPAVVVLAGTRCFRRTPEPNRVLLAVKLRRFGSAGGRGGANKGATTEVTEQTTEVTESDSFA